jgi:hypothetical protein
VATDQFQRAPLEGVNRKETGRCAQAGTIDCHTYAVGVSSIQMGRRAIQTAASTVAGSPHGGVHLLPFVGFSSVSLASLSISVRCV